MKDQDLDLSDEPFWIASICERPVRLFRSERAEPELPWTDVNDLFEAVAWPPAGLRERLIKDMTAAHPHRSRLIGAVTLVTFYTTREIMDAAVEAKAAPASCVDNYGSAFADFLIKQSALDGISEDEACAYMEQAAKNTFDRDVRGEQLTRKKQH